MFETYPLEDDRTNVVLVYGDVKVSDAAPYVAVHGLLFAMILMKSTHTLILPQKFSIPRYEFGYVGWPVL